MLSVLYFLFILRLGLACGQEPNVSIPGASTPQGLKDSEFLPTEDFDVDEKDLMLTLQKRIALPILRDLMKLIAKLDGTSLKSLWNILNNMQASRTFLDVLFYEFLSEFTGEELELPPELSEELQDTEYLSPYKMVHKSGSLDVPCKESNTLKSDQESVFDIKDWEVLDSNRGSDLAFGDDEYVSNLTDEPTDARYKYPIQIGSIVGVPGENFPDYYDIPITSFTCTDKKRIPGFYADLETGCQVFHVCWPHRRESFLCPVGTIFNQAILACDYWYSTDCSLSPLYYDNDPFAHADKVPTASTESVIGDHLEKTTDETPARHHISSEQSIEYIPKDGSHESLDLSNMVKFLPVKYKITYPEPIESTTRDSISLLHEFKESKPEQDVEARTKEDSDDVLLSEVLGIADDVAKEARKFVAKLQSKDTRHRIQAALKTKSEVHEPHKKHVSKPIPLVIKKPVVPVIPKEHQLTKINPRFVVKPVSLKISHEKPKVVPLIKSSKLHKASKPLKGHSLKAAKFSKEYAPAILNKSFKFGSALHGSILPLTKKILLESYARHLKVMKH
ncbi:chitin-binding type-2 domain-containing protein [Trichonephila clavata]|uniref:Chitin-binding type-2 domain-containing protein n=1 Tax=Trichonephila clavata TaxID=2740835 RepID=A0A8X6L8X4_TRICU|nr:chitin-binding type-2 domain-containing protein [Trichonephila clavata]